MGPFDKFIVDAANDSINAHEGAETEGPGAHFDAKVDGAEVEEGTVDLRDFTPEQAAMLRALLGMGPTPDAETVRAQRRAAMAERLRSAADDVEAGKVEAASLVMAYSVVDLPDDAVSVASATLTSDISTDNARLFTMLHAAALRLLSSQFA